jgi:hypothetical protein
LFDSVEASDGRKEQAIDVPNECIETVCKLKQELYYQGELRLTRFYEFSQNPTVEETAIWWSNYIPSRSYKNGDTASNDIIPRYGYQFLRDDLRNTETSPEQIYPIDRHGNSRTDGWAQKIYLCID